MLKLPCDLTAYCTFGPGRFCMALVYFSTGSNQGDRLEALLLAITRISSEVGKVIAFSPVVESEPWGFEASVSFYNQVMLVDTQLSPLQVLEKVLAIETSLGRIRTAKGYSNRTLDIDILFYNDAVLNQPRLTVPHPHMHKRRFVLFPLWLLAPDMIHPVLKLNTSELLNNLDDNSIVTVIVETEEFARLRALKPEFKSQI